MDEPGVINIILAAISALAAGLSVVVAFIAKGSAKSSADAANAINMGMIEMNIRANISAASNRYEDLLINIPKSKQQSNEFKAVVESAIEKWLNAYDDACGLYIDSEKIKPPKIDTDRFKKNYYREITDLIENKDFECYFFPKEKSYYKKLLIVYEEWTNLEYK